MLVCHEELETFIDMLSVFIDAAIKVHHNKQTYGKKSSFYYLSNGSGGLIVLIGIIAP